MLWASGLTPVATEKEQSASMVNTELAKASPWRTPPLKRSREALESLRATQSPPSNPSLVARARTETALRLDEAIPAREVSKRVGPGGKALYYLQGWQAIQVANEIFGYSGWSNALQSFQIDYCEQGPDSRWNAMATAVMRVTLLETGAFHEDVGCGVCDGMRTRGDALQKVKKEACTDAMKRALKNFGRRLGLMLYDKEFLAMLARGNVGGGALPGARDARQAPVVGRIPAIPSRPLGGAPKAKDSKTDRTRNMSLPPTLEPHPTISIPRGTSTDSSSCSGSAAVGVNETTVSNTPAPHAPPAAKDPAMTNGSECSWDLATRQELDSILQQFELDDEC